MLPMQPQAAAPAAPRSSRAKTALAVLVLCLALGVGVALLAAQRRGGGAPMAYLQITPGQPPLPLSRGTVLIGRGAQAAVRLLDDQASSAHASLAWSAAGFVLTDHGSTNGTFVNGRRVAAPTVLKIGDTIRIGHTELRLVGGSGPMGT